LITFWLSFFALTLLPLAAFLLLRRWDQLQEIGRGWDQFKNWIWTLVAILLIAGASLGYITANPVSYDQLFYLPFISLDVLSMAFVFLVSRHPSPAQRRIGDRLGELRSYLKGDATSAEMSVAIYERYLPFAIALGVETIWTSRFNKWREDTGMETYEPEWLVPQNSV
jgi:hypothetical protein